MGSLLVVKQLKSKNKKEIKMHFTKSLKCNYIKAQGFFSLLIILLLSGNLFAQVQVNAAIDKTKIVIGDQFTASVRISAPKGSQFLAVNYKAWEEKGVELLDIKPMLTTSEEPELLMEQQLKLTSFDTGYHRLPSLEVIYELNGLTDTAFSNALNLDVVGLKVQEDAPIRDNKGIIKEAINWRDIVPYVVGLLVLLLIGGIVWKLAQKQPKVEEKTPPPPVPAHIVALDKLKKLKAEALWEKGEIKAFQSQLTYVFREYLEKRFGLKALEETTSEITAQLSNTNINSEQQEVLKDILQTADMVKFAKAVPPEDIHSKALETINLFVEKTKIEVIEELENNKTTP